MTLAEMKTAVVTKYKEYEDSVAASEKQITEAREALSTASINAQKALEEGKQAEYHTYNAEVNYLSDRLAMLRNQAVNHNPYTVEEFASVKTQCIGIMAAIVLEKLEAVWANVEAAAAIVEQIKPVMDENNEIMTILNSMVREDQRSRAAGDGLYPVNYVYDYFVIERELPRLFDGEYSDCGRVILPKIDYFRGLAGASAAAEQSAE